MHSWDKYAQQAVEFCGDISEMDIPNLALMGLVGESGEVVDVLKKWRYQYPEGTQLPIGKIVEECGDVLWYCALMHHEIGVKMSIQQRFITKIHPITGTLELCRYAVYMAKAVHDGFIKMPDIIAFLDAILTYCGSSIEEAMEKNIEKLIIRYPEGFDGKRSEARDQRNDRERIAAIYREIEQRNRANAGRDSTYTHTGGEGNDEAGQDK